MSLVNTSYKVNYKAGKKLRPARLKKPDISVSYCPYVIVALEFEAVDAVTSIG